MVQPETIREIEMLFLVGRYEEAVHRCKVELKIIEIAHKNAVKSDEDSQSAKNGRHGKGKEREPVDPDVATDRFHSASVPLVSLLIQNLYELKRTREIPPFIESYYSSFLSAPFEVVYMSLNVRISTGELKESEILIKEFDEKYRSFKKAESLAKIDSAGKMIVNPLNDTTDAVTNQAQPLSARHRRSSGPKPTALTLAQYEDLIELLAIHVLCPSDRFEEATQILRERQSLLRPTRFEEVMNTVLDLETAKNAHIEDSPHDALKVPSNPILIQPDAPRRRPSKTKKVTFLDQVDEGVTPRRASVSLLTDSSSSSEALTPTPKDGSKDSTIRAKHASILQSALRNLRLMARSLLSAETFDQVKTILYENRRLVGVIFALFGILGLSTLIAKNRQNIMTFFAPLVQFLQGPPPMPDPLLNPLMIEAPRR